MLYISERARAFEDPHIAQRKRKSWVFCIASVLTFTFRPLQASQAF
jgi:hypothetical protein